MTSIVSEMEFESVEEATQNYAEYKSEERSRFWDKADYVDRAREKFGRGIISALAHTAGESVDWTSRLGRCARAFPPEHRYPDVGSTIYIECLNWSQPLEALRMALTEGFSARTMRELRIPKLPPDVILCPKCGTQVFKN